MALTLRQAPQDITPAYNKQYITAISNQIAIADFKYIVTVEVNGSGQIYTENILQRPDGYLVFDAQQWVKNYIEHYFNPTLSLATPIEVATNKLVSVDIYIKEYYSGTIHTADQERIRYSAFDGCLNDKAFSNYNFYDYLFNENVGKLFLSKTINTITPDNRLMLGQDLFIHFIQNLTTPIDNIIVNLQRGAVILGTVTIAALPSAGTLNLYVMRLNSTMFTTATPQVGDFIKIAFRNAANTVILVYSITLKELCTKYKDYVLYYLDRDGNILFFHFEKLSKTNFNKKVNSVTLQKDKLNIAFQYKSNSWDREVHNISTMIDSTITLNTDWITETQSTQLNDLFSSPIVYLWDGTEYRPVTITTNSYEEYKLDNESLFNYSVTCSFDTMETRQRGI
jgi:hypothetical protein